MKKKSNTPAPPADTPTAQAKPAKKSSKGAAAVTPPPVKRGPGQPTKLTEALALKIFMLGRKGLTDKEIAFAFDIDERTLGNWKKSPEFFQALKDAKEVADVIVERSLYERATGYSHPEDKIFIVNGKVKRVEVTKYYPPDPTSIIFFLKNRKPDAWRDRIPELSNLADELGSVLKQLRRHAEKKGHEKAPKKK